MAAFSFSTCSVFYTCKKFPNSNQNAKWHFKKNYKQPVNCPSGPFSSVVSVRSSSTDVSQPNSGGSSTSIATVPVNSQQAVSGVLTDSLLEMVNDNGIGIKKFLEGKTIFLTGATGFLGKVLIEKILRTVPDVRKMYILVKANNKEVAMKRVENEIINGELFKSLKQQHGKSYQSFMLSKIEPIIGNIRKNNLGLDKNVAVSIAFEVDIIVNSAANTTFDERYDVALDINTIGPSRLMSFAMQCHKIMLFVQVSTAYVNGQRQGRVMERPFYSGESILQGSDLNVDDEIKLAQYANQGLHVDDPLLTQKMKKLALERANKFGWQDSYVFTKAMGEMMIENMRGDLPVVTIRPSIIESTCRDPFPGWIEGIRMMEPVILYIGKGLITGFLIDPNEVLDVVPVDMVVNAIIASMAKHGAAGKPGSNVYQITSSVVNPLVNKDLFSYFYEHFKSSPLIDSKGAPVFVSRLKMLTSMEDFSTDLWKEPVDHVPLNAHRRQISYTKNEKIKRLSRKSIEQIMNLANLYKPYTFYKGRFDSNNIKMLMESMSKEENMEFGFDVNEIDWNDYIVNIHIPGFRKYVLKGRLG